MIRRYVPYTERHGATHTHVPTDSDEPRCDITGQPLTIQQRFNQECG